MSVKCQLCPVRQKRSKAFLGYYTVLGCVMVVPSFCVLSQRLSAINFIKVCWITGALSDGVKTAKETAENMCLDRLGKRQCQRNGQSNNPLWAK